jgi:transcriptional antiterminator NusG
MIEDLREKTDQPEEPRAEDAEAPEQPGDLPEPEAMLEAETPPEIDESRDEEAASEVEESPDVESPEPDRESPDAETPETEESPDAEAPEETESPETVAPAEPEESLGVESDHEGEESPDAQAAPVMEPAIEEPEPPAAMESPPDAPAPSETDAAPVATSAESDAAAEEKPTESAAAEEQAVSDGDPFSGPGDWYVIHTYAGYENKVKTNLGSRIQTMQMQDKIFDVVVPMEDVMEIKGGKKQVVQKKVFPGYLLVKMIYDNDSWYVVRNTPGVTGFVASGTGQKPTPLPRREVEKFLAAKSEETKPAFRLEFEEQDVVRIISGPFTEFTGTIAEINVDQSKLKVMVNIFDRETPVELGFDQVAKV